MEEQSWQKIFLDAFPTVDLIAGTGRIVLIIILFIIIRSAIGIVLRRLETRLAKRAEADGEIPSEARKRADTLVRLIKQGTHLALWILLALMLLKEIGFEIGPILASAGIVGVALGFGAQNLVRDLIAGFFIILENQIRVGDVAIINGTGGIVESINFRTVRTRDLAGVVHIFPNGTINTLSNMTSDWSAYLMDIGVAYKEDPDKVMEVMKQVAEQMQEDPLYEHLITNGLEIFGVDNFGDSAIVIKARLVTKPIAQWKTGREYRRRLKKAFDHHGIEIPFPHRSLYFGEASKPVMVQLMEQSQKQNET